MPSVIVVGAQWGDEGKGKIIDLLTKEARHVVRAQGGNNAGHTIVANQQQFKLHLIPSGIIQPHTQCYIGAGVVIDPQILLDEIKILEDQGIEIKSRLWISPCAHVIFPYHKQLDLLIEDSKGTLSIGTTGRGIGPCYADKANRIGIRMGELIRPDVFKQKLKETLAMKNRELTKLYESAPLTYETLLSEYMEYAEKLRPLVTNVETQIHQAIKRGENLLFEGAQGTFLDLTSGTYPYVTSSNTVSAGVCVGAGVGPRHVDHVVGVIKAYLTRVGNGPLPTELQDEEIFLNHHTAREFGTTTQRRRRIGWFDAVLAKTAAQLNGFHSIALTKLDVLDTLEEIKICVAYEIDGKQITEVPDCIEDFERIQPVYESHPGWLQSTQEIRDYAQLPQNAQNYLNRISLLCQVPISMVSTGPERERTLIVRDLFGKSEVMA